MLTPYAQESKAWNTKTTGLTKITNPIRSDLNKIFGYLNHHTSPITETELRIQCRLSAISKPWETILYVCRCELEPVCQA